MSTHSVRSRSELARLFGAAWFGLLAVVTVWGLRLKLDAGITVDLAPSLLAGVSGIIFYATISLLILTRPPAKAQSAGLLPKVAALVGTYMPWSIAFFGKSNDPLLNVISSICLVTGTIMVLVTIRHLGKAFSMVPQARSVVQTGPYRWIRHPLYASEGIAILGVVLQHLSLATVVVFVVQIAIQICRIHYEEGLLRRTLPGYTSYEASRWRLIPCVW